MSTASSPDATTLATLAALEFRLQRLTFYLTGETESPEELQDESATVHKIPAQARLQALEQSLAELVHKKPGIRGLLELQANYPDLFHPSISSSTPPPTALTDQEILAMVTASAPAYHQTASRLTALKDLPLPSADSSSALVALLPRMEKVELEQEEQEREIAALRERSSRVIQLWYEAGVLGEGECWGEWEARVSGVEKLVRRRELLRRREEEEEQAYKP